MAPTRKDESIDVLAFFEHDDRLSDIKALMDALPIGVILLDRTISVRLVNAEAQAVLRSRAEFRIVGPTAQVRRIDEKIGFTESVRSVFATGEASTFVFFSRAGIAELSIGLRLVGALDLVLATVALASPRPALVTAPDIQATVERLSDGTMTAPSLPEGYGRPPHI